MATTSSRTRSSGPVLQKSNRYHGFHRSTSPSGRFCSSTMSSSATAFASSSSSFSSSATGFFNRSASPTMSSSSSPQSQSVRFAIERPTSPSRSIAVSPRNQVVKKQTSNTPTPKRTCMCSPTNHPGSFRCSLHKNTNHNVNNTVSCSSNRLNARRSAMTNSLVRIGTVEGDWVKRALAALIRPSSHQQKRREGFQPRPSRLSVMSNFVDFLCLPCDVSGEASRSEGKA